MVSEMSNSELRGLISVPVNLVASMPPNVISALPTPTGLRYVENKAIQAKISRSRVLD